MAGLTALTLPLCLYGTLGLESSRLVDCSATLLSFPAVFFGIRSCRRERKAPPEEPARRAPSVA